MRIISLFMMAMMATASIKAQDNKILRHVVIFKFKEGSSDSDIRKVEDAFRALPSQKK